MFSLLKVEITLFGFLIDSFLKLLGVKIDVFINIKKFTLRESNRNIFILYYSEVPRRLKKAIATLKYYLHIDRIHTMKISIYTFTPSGEKTVSLCNDRFNGRREIYIIITFLRCLISFVS